MKNLLILNLTAVLILTSTPALADISYNSKPTSPVLITVGHKPKPPQHCLQQKPVCSLRTRTEAHYQIFTVLIGHNAFGEFETYQAAIGAIRQLRLDQLCL